VFYRQKNRGKPDAIVEEDDAESGSKLGRAVAASEIGLSCEDWSDSVELEAFLGLALDVKERIEHKGWLTAAQSVMLLYDLKESCSSSSLDVQRLPVSPAFKDRTRVHEERLEAALCDAVSTAREVLQGQLERRFFTERPSNARLVLMFMSKQMPMAAYAPESWMSLAKSIYLQYLREAEPLLTSATVQKVAQKLPDEQPRKKAFRHVLAVGLGGDDTISTSDQVPRCCLLPGCLAAWLPGCLAA
jgi:hypothetical protein